MNSDTILVTLPKNKTIREAVLTILNSFKISFTFQTQEKAVKYSEEFDEKMRVAEEDIKYGRVTTLSSKDDIKQFIDSL